MTTTQLLLDSKKIIRSSFFNQFPISMFIWNNDDYWSIKEVSKNISKLLGYEQEDFVSGKVIYYSLIHPDDISRVKHEVSFNSYAKNSNFIHDSYRIKKKNGTYIWVEDATSIVYKDNEITHYIGYIKDCTKEIESMQKLEDSRQMWINAIENNGDGLWEWNILTNEVYYSTQWKKMLGFEENEISNHVFEWEKRVHPKDIKKVQEEIANYLNGKTDKYISEHRILCKDGHYKWILDRGSITKYSENGEKRIFTGTHLDISKKKDLEKKLEKSISYNRVLIDNLPFLIWLKDKNSNFLKVNQSFANASKLIDPKLLINKNDFDIWPKKLAQKYVRDDKKVLKSGKNNRVQEKIMINNEEKWFETFKAPVYDKNNELLGSVGHAQDITERIEIEKKLKSQNEQIELERLKLSTIIHSLPDLFWIKDKNGVYLSCNKRFEDFIGVSESKIIGKTDYDFLSKNIADSFRKYDRNAMSSDIPLSNYEEITFASDGHKEYIHTTKTKVAFNDGKIYGILGISRNISHIKQYQDEIIEQKEEFETIFNNSMDGIAILDLNSKILKCNDAYSKMLDYTKEELYTKSWIEINLPEDREKIIEIIQNVIKKGFIKNFEKRCFTKSKKQIYINISISLLPDKKRLLLVTKEISHLKFIEEQSKLVAMAEMIGNIAHQWRQPLSIISTASTGLKLQKEYNNLSDEQFIETCDIINENAQYLSATIEDFGNFIKKDGRLELVSIKDSIEYALQLLASTMKNNYINLIVNLDYDLKIYANKNELAQSFINIINNAKDALLEKDDLSRYISIKTKRNGKTLELTICDSGGGIPENIIGRIFEPYFTTKHQSQGTGIGLSMVNKILRDRYNAVINVYNHSLIFDNNILYGACFKIIFNDENYET